MNNKRPGHWSLRLQTSYHRLNLPPQTVDVVINFLRSPKFLFPSLLSSILNI